MSDYVDNHPLSEDLPEYRQAIRDMKMSDRHFSRLLEQYEELDKRIVRFEQGLGYADDLELDDLKMKRVQLKDDLLNQLKNNGS